MATNNPRLAMKVAARKWDCLMRDARPGLERLVFVVLGLTVAAIGAVYIFKQARHSPAPLPVLAVVPDFSLTNQLGDAIGLGDLRGKVWLSDIIFTRCAGPCPRLTSVFHQLNQQLADVSDLQFVSLTADPGHDTPEVLERYSAEHGAEPARWWFLTGAKGEINRMAVRGLKLALVEKEASERTDLNDLFIHSTALTLVDKQGRVRGFFQGLEPDAPQRVEKAIRDLAAEP